MKSLKIISIITLILSMTSMIFGMGVSTYYIDNLKIRGLSVFILTTSSVFVSNLVGRIFRELK